MELKFRRDFRTEKKERESYLDKATSKNMSDTK